MEYLVNISKMARVPELKLRYLKITVLTTNTLYPSRKIRRICACTSQKTTKEKRSIRLIPGKTNTPYSSYENKIFWKISNVIPTPRNPQYANSTYLGLRKKYRLNLSNDMPPRDKKVYYIMDNPNITMEEYIRLEEEKACRHGKVYNWETAKYAIVYNDALTSKSDFLPILCPQHIDEFDLKDETTLSEYDKVEQNVLYFNDLFPFNIIYPDELKSGFGREAEDGGQEILIDSEMRLDVADTLCFQLGGARRTQYLFRHTEGRKSDARLLGGHFIAILLITLVWRLEEEIHRLRQDVRSLRGLIERSMTDQGRLSTWMVSCMTQLMTASGRTYQAFDGTFRGSYPVVFERRTKCKTDGANTSTTQHDEHQPDP
uniref:Uncharacterized protein n=1 Tax=Tanacetum cinerariifolium TaxID=118510 RepID=A0A6L2JJ76_TANCI|nr:hypothetical protein [Tanacetum cinerariifolium]